MEHVRAVTPSRSVLTMGYLWEKRGAGDDPKDDAIFRGAEAHALSKGFRLERFNPAEARVSGRRLSKILYSRGIDGLVLAPLAQVRRDQMELDWNRFAVAAVGYSVWRPIDLHRAYSDDYNIMLQLLARLVDLGYRRIGFAVPRDADRVVNYMWTAALLRFQQDLPVGRRVSYLSPPQLNFEAFRSWVKKKRPDVVIGVSDATLVWLRSFARVPRDCGWATVFWQERWKEASGYDQNFELMGAAAVDLVVNQLNAGERGLPSTPKTVLLEGAWKSGSTLRSQ